MVWEVEFLDKKDAICYTGISMWKESYKNEEIFCNPWASHFGIDWLFAIPNKKTTTASSSSSSSVKKEVKNEEKTTTLVGDINGTKHRDIIKSKGDKVENLRIEVTADLPKQLGTIAAEKSPEELTAAIQALLEQNEDYKKLKTVPVLVWSTQSLQRKNCSQPVWLISTKLMASL